MKKFTNALDNIKIASPCPADWNAMRGDNRKRFCSECKLNVYNLSDMTLTEAESFLINSEGSVCMQIYRRKDGTVLTKNCPVGFAKLKKKASRAATAVFTMIATFLSGIFALGILKSLRTFTNYDKVPEIFFQTEPDHLYEQKEGAPSFGGLVSNLSEIKSEILKQKNV